MVSFLKYVIDALLVMIDNMRGEQEVNIDDFFNGLFEINHIYGLIYSIFGAFILWVCKMIYDFFSTKSKYAGTWEVKTFNDDGSLKQEHILVFKHNRKTGIIIGTVQKISSEPIKKHQIIGVLKQEKIIYNVYTDEPVPSMKSVHTIFAGERYFKGFYLSNEPDTIEINKTPCELKKIESKNNYARKEYINGK